MTSIEAKIIVKIVKVLSVTILSAITVTGNAQNRQDDSRFGRGEDSIQCLQNLNMLMSYAKQGDYYTAYEHWHRAYYGCPASHISIYHYGPIIITHLLEREKTVQQKEKWLTLLMGVYDNRLKYFGDNPRQGKGYILGRKAIDYIRYINPNRDPLKKNAYKWLSEAIALDGSASEATVFLNYFKLSERYYKNNPESHRETYINDYLKVMSMLNERATSGDPRDTVYVVMKTMVNAIFVQSDAVDCRRLDNIYRRQIELKKDNSAFLENILMLYKNMDCEESPVYFEVAAHQYKIASTSASATGMALASYQKREFFKAIGYFQEAVSLEKNKDEKSKLQMRIAAIYNELGDYTRARAESRAALSHNPSNASAYIMIAYLYVNYASLISKNHVIQKTAYWAAVDKLEMAKKVDPGCADIVNRLINSYKSNYPSDREQFLNDIIGDTYVVPGWIQEKTTIR